jgi:hypothetical protein
MELCSEQGANDFISLNPPFNFFSVNLPHASAIYKRVAKSSSKSVKAAEKNQLTQIYFTIDSFAKYGYQEIFLTIPEAEIQLWFQHVIPQLAILQQDPAWMKHGKLEQYQSFLLIPNSSLMMHEVPAKTAFETGFFQAVADLLAIHKPPALPCQDIAETICLICGNLFITLTLAQPSPWCCDMFFKKLETTGLLVQLLRCSTMPLPGGPNRPGDIPCLMKMYEDLSKSASVVKKYFKKGDPCGDTLRAILDGRDGWRKGPKRRTRVLNYFTHISSLANLVDAHTSPGSNDVDVASSRSAGGVGGGGSSNNNGNGCHDEGTVPSTKSGGSIFKMCRYCNKGSQDLSFQKSLMVCGRCKSKSEVM